MSDKTVRVRVQADISDYLGKFKTAAKGAQDLGSAVEQAAAKQKTAAGSMSGSLDSVTDKQREAMIAAREAGMAHHEAWKRAGTTLIGFGVSALGAAATAAGGYMKFDASVSKIKATGADARENIDALTQAAMDAGREFGQFSATDASNGITELVKAGVSATDVLGGGLRGALALAAAGELDVAQAAETTAITLAQFELSGSDASRVADLLAAGAGEAAGSVSDMAAALRMSGTVSHQYGVSIEETVGALSLFAQNALLGSDSGTSMKQMLLQLASPTKEAAKALEEYGITAYDSQGSFVGIANLAEQLKVSLGDLSQEQQNAALKTIFGADAIRSATILMGAGAEGVRKWTDAVSESGYAMDSSSILMDNLKGDLAGLQGSWETLTIKMGSSANGPLRDMVQGITGTVDALGNMPPELQAAAMGTTVFIGAAALTTGAAMKMTTSAHEAYLAYKGFSEAFPKFSGFLKSFAGVAAGAAVGFALLNIAGSAYQSNTDKQLASTEKVTASIQDLAEASRSAAGVDVLNENFRIATNGAMDFSAAIDYINNKTSGIDDTINRWVDGIAPDKVFGIKTSLASVTDEVAKTDKALASLSQSDAASAFTNLLEQTGRSAEEVAPHLTEYRAKLESVAVELSKQVDSFSASSLSAQDYADWMGGKVPAAVRAAIGVAQAGTPVQKEFATSLDDTAQAAADAAEALRDSANAALQTSGSWIALEASIDAASESVKANKKTLDINTQGGRANKAALDSIASSSLKLQDSLAAQNATSKQVSDAQNRGYAAFIRAATGMGMAGSAAKDLAAKYGLVPKKVQSNISQVGAEAAKVKADALRTALLSIKPEHRTKVTSAFNAGGVEAARRALNAIDGKVATTYINTIQSVTQRVTGALGGTQRRATLQADGSVLDFYPQGGLRRENHTAHIAPAGSWRIFGEDETGGEAYIPLSLTKRRRSVQILETVADRFGMRVEKFALGGVTKSSSFGVVNRLTSSSQLEWAALIGAVSSLRAAMAQNTAAAKAGGAERRSLAATLKTRDSLRGQSRDLAAQQKREDAAANKRVAEARALPAGASRTRAVEAAQSAKTALDKKQKTQSLALSKKLVAAEGAYTAALGKAKPFLDKHAAALANVKAKKGVLSDIQKEIADTAKAFSSAFSSKYGMGGSVADWIGVMAEGKTSLSDFATQLQKLRDMGLDESLVQKIADKGPDNGGSDMAAEIISGGKTSIGQLNKAATALQTAADKLGTVQAVGTVKRAAGGSVWGAGTSTSDDIQANLSNGEYVTRTWAARQVGYWTMDYINRYGRVPFRNGGRADGSPAFSGVRSPQGYDSAMIASAVREGLASTRLVLAVDGMAGLVDARVERAEQESDMSLRTRGVR